MVLYSYRCTMEGGKGYGMGRLGVPDYYSLLLLVSGQGEKTGTKSKKDGKEERRRHQHVKDYIGTDWERM